MFNGEPEEDWQDWMQQHYLQLRACPRTEKSVPYYVLIAGGPDQIPFHFQTLLDSAAAVERVTSDTITDLEAYVEKVLRYERASNPAASREALFFATDGGPGDATHFSRRFMADPPGKACPEDATFSDPCRGSPRMRPRNGFSTRRGRENPRSSIPPRMGWPHRKSGWQFRSASRRDLLRP